LAILGASGTVVGIVSGLGELFGYGFRMVSGYISDRTGKYWMITLIGYSINLLAVPLLAFTGSWHLAAVLIIAERFGKAIRTPARDAILSYVTKEIGRGWGFGIHKAMDQTGATLGPLVVSIMLYYHGTYQMSFFMLLIPGVCALAVLTAARFLYPRPQDLEIENPSLVAKEFPKKYWLYIMAICCIAAGYIDFPLIAYHFEKGDSISQAWIPIFFSIAMASNGLSALIFGKLYDMKGIGVLVIVVAVSAFFAPLVFTDGFYPALIGMVLWGIGMGAQESVMRAVVANMVQKNKRGTAYGVMNMWFGVFWFLGSALTGYLYDISLTTLILFSLLSQLAAIPFLLIIGNTIVDGHNE
jgi:MFS family permease